MYHVVKIDECSYYLFRVEDSLRFDECEKKTLIYVDVRWVRLWDNLITKCFVKHMICTWSQMFELNSIF